MFQYMKIVLRWLWRATLYSVAYAVVRCVSVRRHLRVLYRNDGKHILTFFHRLRDPPFQFLRTIRYGSIFQPGTPIVYLVWWPSQSHETGQSWTASVRLSSAASVWCWYVIHGLYIDLIILTNSLAGWDGQIDRHIYCCAAQLWKSTICPTSDIIDTGFQ